MGLGRRVRQEPFRDGDDIFESFSPKKIFVKPEKLKTGHPLHQIGFSVDHLENQGQEDGGRLPAQIKTGVNHLNSRMRKMTVEIENAGQKEARVIHLLEGTLASQRERSRTSP